MVVVRVATSGDLNAIMQLEVATSEAPHWTLNNYEKYLSETDPAKRILLAERDGKLLGFIAGRVVASGGELESIVVSKDVRRSGIGTELMSTLYRWLTERQVSRLELEVRAGNNTAIGFYGRHGFHVDGRRKGYYSDPEEDALLMSRSLEQR